MNAYLKMLLMSLAVAGLYVPAIALAQKSVGGVTGEARLHPGTWGSERSSRSYARSRTMYRSTAPVIVRSEPAEAEVAQAPSERRSYSYEPSQQNVSGDACHCGCGETVTTGNAPATAERSTEARRSYSYEPSIQSDRAPRTYSVRPSRRSGWVDLGAPKAERNNPRN